jgi:hypothetical protein
MKISRLRKRRQPWISMEKPTDEIARAVRLEKVQAYLEINRTRYLLQAEKLQCHLENLKIEGGVLAGPFAKRKKS